MTPRAILFEIAENAPSHYRKWSEKDERTGKVRQFRAPRPELKAIQKGILRILKSCELDDSAHGGVKHRSARTNAEKHLAQPLVVSIDVQSFFPNVSHHMVNRLFRHELGFGRDVASLLTRLTTLDGQLPQGTPTSLAIANLYLRSVDVPLSALARTAQMVNTRFVDDLAFSGDGAQFLINHAAKALSRKGLSISRKAKKLRIMPRSGPQVVTGLHVNSITGPSTSRAYRSEVRLKIHQFTKLPPGPGRDAVAASIRGKIQHVAQYNRGSARRLLAALTGVAGNTTR
jgi:RNA-directed DNA polymerase